MIIIAEKINGTIPEVRDAIIDRDDAFISGLAASQQEAGASFIDVNVGTGIGDECEAMAWAVEVVRKATDLPLCVDSSDPLVIEAGLEICGDTSPFINSVNGTQRSMELVLPLAARYSCPLIALPVDDAGIPTSPGERLDVCAGIYSLATGLGIPPGNIYFDPLVLPLSADCKQAGVTLETLRVVKAAFGESKSAMGASNVSFGLPARSLINRSLLTVAIYFGLDAALLDPTDRELRASIYSATAISGTDRFCKDYMKAFRAGALGDIDG